jgi:NOL1/NOP2/fmu family ribosome biogenesis protein
LEALSSKHSDASRLHDAGRLWPHRLKGEGHFVARIRKAADPAISHEESNTRTRTKTKTSTKTKSAKIPQPSRKLWESFLLDNFHLDSNDVHDLSWIQPHGISSQAGLVMFGDHLYASPCPNLDITGLKVVRPGVYLGECKTNRFEPGHGLALAVNPKRAKRTVNLQASSQEVVSYLRGESLHIEGERGWTLVTVDGYPIGFAKSDGKTLKNHYPKGLRWIK